MIERDRLIALLRQYIQCDATGLAPAVASVFLTGFEEAADAILAEPLDQDSTFSDLGEARPLLFEAVVPLGGYPLRVVVKEADWRSAVHASPVFLAMGKGDKAWAWTSKAALDRLIATLQDAAAVARDPA